MVNEGRFDDAIRRLFASEAFAAQQRLGHQLIPGAALTSMSEVPFEMRLKCGICAAVIWFTNVTCQAGKPADWRLAEESHEYAGIPCLGANHEGFRAAGGRSPV